MARSFSSASSQYLLNSNAVVTTTPLTMACWAKTPEVASTHGLIYLADLDVNTHYFYLASGGGTENVLCRAAAGGSPAAAVVLTAHSVTQWYHACGVFASPTSRAAYLNGGNKATNTTSRTPANIESTSIGAGYRGAFSLLIPTNGLIAEAAIWNIALSDAEVADLAKGFCPLLIRPESLVGYWPLIGRASPEPDIVGNFDMELVNAPTQADHPRIIYPSRRKLIIPPSVVSEGDILEWESSVTAIINSNINCVRKRYGGFGSSLSIGDNITTKVDRQCLSNSPVFIGSTTKIFLLGGLYSANQANIDSTANVVKTAAIATTDLLDTQCDSELFKVARFVTSDLVELSLLPTIYKNAVIYSSNSLQINESNAYTVYKSTEVSTSLEISGGFTTVVEVGFQTNNIVAITGSLEISIAKIFVVADYLSIQPESVISVVLNVGLFSEFSLSSRQNANAECKTISSSALYILPSLNIIRTASILISSNLSAFWQTDLVSQKQLSGTESLSVNFVANSITVKFVDISGTAIITGDSYFGRTIFVGTTESIEVSGYSNLNKVSGVSFSGLVVVSATANFVSDIAQPSWIASFIVYITEYLTTEISI